MWWLRRAFYIVSYKRASSKLDECLVLSEVIPDGSESPRMMKPTAHEFLSFSFCVWSHFVTRTGWTVKMCSRNLICNGILYGTMRNFCRGKKQDILWPPPHFIDLHTFIYSHRIFCRLLANYFFPVQLPSWCRQTLNIERTQLLATLSISIWATIWNVYFLRKPLLSDFNSNTHLNEHSREHVRWILFAYIICKPAKHINTVIWH